jgi:tRNA(Arg) A34 adenosine deaminase TadA
VLAIGKGVSKRAFPETRQMSRWYQMAKRLSAQSRHTKQQMGAIIFKGGRVLSHAVNSKRVGRHAEIRALTRDVDFQGASIVIARSSGGCSKPCRVCYLLIQSLGLREMLFIDESGSLVKRKPIDSPDKYKSMYMGV